jgi:pyrimidine operon attenuation protein/uracil phosphoribosyltransferase
MNTHAPIQGKSVLDAEALGRTLSRIAHEIIEGNPSLRDVALVGIQTRGVPLARRLARLVEERAGVEPALGAVDITFYRDDVTVRGGEAPLAAQPLVRATQLDFPLDGRTVVLVDDVLYTGRTIRAAIEALFDYGRPARVQLAGAGPTVVRRALTTKSASNRFAASLVAAIFRALVAAGLLADPAVSNH